jgi:hypothetical protein
MMTTAAITMANTMINTNEHEIDCGAGAASPRKDYQCRLLALLSDGNVR